MKSIAFLCIVLASVCHSETVTYKIVRDSPEVLVEFAGKAPYETFAGRTRIVTGFIEIHNLEANGSGRAEIHVDLTSLDTGNEQHNTDLRANQLETSVYPEAVFVGLHFELPSVLIENESLPVVVRGTLYLHGVTREISPTVFVTKREHGEKLQIESRFRVRLEDFQIRSPGSLGPKVAEEQYIKFDITAIRDGAESIPRHEQTGEPGQGVSR